MTEKPITFIKEKKAGDILEKNELAVCDECGSLFYGKSSQMMGLCPECAHILYGYPNCIHHFRNGRCVNCYWDGSESEYIKSLKKG